MRYLFEHPDRVVVGAHGEVGQRRFLLQVRQGPQLVVVKVEKQQVVALAEWVVRVLDDLGRPGHLPEDVELEPEYEADLEAGSITVALDSEAQVLTVSIEAREGDDLVEFSLSATWAAALAIEVTRLVTAGRPPCPLCGLPLDPRGHDCPRTNGHRAPLT